MDKLIKIYTSEMGKYRDPAAYRLAAIFMDEDMAARFIKDNHGKGPFAHRDMIVKEAPFTDDPSEGKTVEVIAVTGECLPLDEAYI